MKFDIRPLKYSINLSIHEIKYFETANGKEIGDGSNFPASSLIFLTFNNTTGSVAMPLKVGTITAGTSFVVDTGDGTNAPAGGLNFNYFIVN